MEQAFIFDDVRLAPKQQIPIHTQNEWELSYVIRGRGTRILGNERQPFYEGEVILIPPHFPHGWLFDQSSVDADGCIHNITLLFAADLPTRLSIVLPEMIQITSVLNAISLPRLYVGDTATAIARLLEDMRQLAPARRVPLVMQLLILVAENTESVELGSSPTGRLTRNIERFRIFCKCNFSENITLDEAAAYMDMNKSAFCKFVKKHTGQTFTEYINSLRLKKAALLLTSMSDPACDIAYGCGFTSIPYFHRLFSRHYGLTPCAYRKHHSQGGNRLTLAAV